MIHGIDHTAISVPDIAEAVSFYCDVLGFEVESESGWPKGAKRVDSLVGLADSSSKVAMVRMGETRIEIFQYTSPEPNPQNPDFRVCDHGITHVCLQVQDLHAEYERMKAAGMRFHSEPLTQETGYVIYGRDPDGNIVELIEFTDTSQAQS